MTEGKSDVMYISDKCIVTNVHVFKTVLCETAKYFVATQFIVQRDLASKS